MKVLLCLLVVLPAALATYSDFFDIYGIGKKEWRLVFRGTANIGKSVFHAYRDKRHGYVEPGCKTADWDAHCNNHYRNDYALDNWKNVQDVMFVIVKKGKIRQTLMFNGTGTDYMSWFSNQGFLNSCYHDLNPPVFIFSIAGHPKLDRRFFIQKHYGGCGHDIGWFVAIDGCSKACNWEQDKESYPIFKYSPGPLSINWNSGHVEKADTIAVFIRYC